MIQIVTASGEMNASIIKGFLESVGIKTNFGPHDSLAYMGSRGPNQLQDIFVEESKSPKKL